LRFQVRAMWVLIWWLLDVYLVINFRVCGISRDGCKLIQTSSLIKKTYNKINKGHKRFILKPKWNEVVELHGINNVSLSCIPYKFIVNNTCVEGGSPFIIMSACYPHWRRNSCPRSPSTKYHLRTFSIKWLSTLKIHLSIKTRN